MNFDEVSAWNKHLNGKPKSNRHTHYSNKCLLKKAVHLHEQNKLLLLEREVMMNQMSNVSANNVVVPLPLV